MAGRRIVVLPELATAGYVFASPDEVDDAALAADDELFAAWADAVRQVRRRRHRRLRRTRRRWHGVQRAAVVDGSGVRAIYRKTHLWDREQEWFVAGDEPPPVVETPVGRIGVAICYDLEFPEVTRHLALAGAESDRRADELAARRSTRR